MLKIKELRLQKGITQNKLAEKLGLSRSTIAMYETDGSEPDLLTLSKLASFFDVSIDYLIGKVVDNNIVSTQFDRDVIKIKIYGKIPAGTPIEMIDKSFIEEYEEIPKAWAKGGKEFFGLKIEGNSMFPEFRNGDTIIFQKVDDCPNGSYCAVSINCTECTFKKVIKKENGITLMPLNLDYEPMFFTNKEVEELPVTILGIVKEIRRSY